MAISVVVELPVDGRSALPVLLFFTFLRGEGLASPRVENCSSRERVRRASRSSEFGRKNGCKRDSCTGKSVMLNLTAEELCSESESDIAIGEFRQISDDREQIAVRKYTLTN